MKLAVGVALAVLATPAAAESRVGASYMMSRPVTGDAGGADHALVLRGERGLRHDVDIGVIVEAGYAPLNDDETLKRVAVLPTIGLRGRVGELVLRGDVALGWQLLDGRTRLGNVPVEGTEPRGLRAELGVAAETAVGATAAIRARVGIAVDAVFPANLDSSTRLGPFVELGALFAL